MFMAQRIVKAIIRRKLLAAATTAATTLSGLTSFGGELPQVNVPVQLRQENYTRGGSCAFASMITLLRWQGRTELADWMRKHYAEGTYAEHYDYLMDKAGVKFASTWGRQDVELLRWACKTRRGACIGIYGADNDPHKVLHMVNLVHLDDKYAGILDNNSTEKIIWMDANVFVDYWIKCGSWAVVPLYSPAPPLPARVDARK